MTCVGCNTPLPDWKTGSRLCQDCRQESLDDWAWRYDHSWDRATIYTWEQHVAIVSRYECWTALFAEKWRQSACPIRRWALCEFCEQHRSMLAVHVRGVNLFGETVEYERAICGECWSGIHGHVVTPKKWWKK